MHWTELQTVTLARTDARVQLHLLEAMLLGYSALRGVLGVPDFVHAPWGARPRRSVEPGKNGLHPGLPDGADSKTHEK